MASQDARPQFLIIIFGPPGSGKVEVTEFLTNQYSMRSVQDNKIRNLVDNWFSPRDTAYWPLFSKLRNEIFQGIAASYLSYLVIPFSWDLAQSSDKEYILNLTNLFEKNLWKVRFVELEASIGSRMKRLHQLRLKSDPDHSFEETEEELMEAEDYQMNTDGTFPLDYPSIRIDTTNMSIDDLCETIIDLLALEI